MGKINRGHSRPCSKLAHGFSHERNREDLQFRRNSVLSADRTPLLRGDPVYERKGAKMAIHLAWDVTGTHAGRGSGTAVVRSCRITSLQNVSTVNRRGMSATLSGDLKRSGGTSLKNTRNLSTPRSETTPAFSNSRSDTLPRASSTIFPRGIFTLKW